MIKLTIFNIKFKKTKYIAAFLLWARNLMAFPFSL